MDIDLLLEDSRWKALALAEVAQKTFALTLAHQGVDTDATEISLLACDDERIAQLNGAFRGKPAATNVLSWPAEDLTSEKAGASPDAPSPGPDGILSLGDIAISYDTCTREAREMGKPIQAHVTHLLVHGLLHLLGYDHIRDHDATLMQGIEAEILGKLGLDDPYRL